MVDTAPEKVTTLLHRRQDGGQDLTCPHCEVPQDILAFKTPHVVGKYADALNVILKCPLCRHVFSPKVFAEPLARD